MKITNRILTVLLLGLCFAGCDKQSTLPERTEQQKRYLYANTFAFNRLNQYYLWKKDIEGELKNWLINEEPIAKVKSVRYADDRWTLLTDDFESLYGSLSGHRKSYGFDYLISHSGSNQVSLVVTYTYADSPARKAGLKRGDVITGLDGKLIPYDSYASVIRQALRKNDSVTLGLQSGDSFHLEAKEMYENPVLLSKVFDCGGKKVGYLVYTSFNLDSYLDLIDACVTFKQAGVKELILDLRYNGGGFNITEQFFGSMLAPEAVVQARSVMSTEVYNEALTESYRKQGIDTKTYFETEYKFQSGGKQYEFSTAGANIGIEKLYAIVSTGTASASEALLGCLYPYMDVTLVGARTHGKFCSGWIMQGPDFYDKEAKSLKEKGIDPDEGKRYMDNWAIYLMIGRFADKNGETRCMPNGLKPDYEVSDNPWDGIPLGDPQEVMLARTLALCGYQTAAPTARRLAHAEAEKSPALIDYHEPGFGIFITERRRPEDPGSQR